MSTMINLRIIGIITMSAAITFFLRALPFLIFRGEAKMPAWLEQLGKKLPAAIMAVLLVYCLKDAKSEPVSQGIPLLIASLFVGITYKWKHNTFFSIVGGTVVYMVLIRTSFF